MHKHGGRHSPITAGCLLLDAGRAGNLTCRSLNAFSDRILPGTDFLASRDKDLDVYREELEVTGRIHRHLDDVAFRNIALGRELLLAAGPGLQDAPDLFEVNPARNAPRSSAHGRLVRGSARERSGRRCMVTTRSTSATGDERNS